MIGVNPRGKDQEKDRNKIRRAVVKLLIGRNNTRKILVNQRKKKEKIKTNGKGIQHRRRKTVVIKTRENQNTKG